MITDSLKNGPLVRRIGSRMFAITGQDPRTRWYSHYKLDHLAHALASDFDPQQLPFGYGLHIDERIVEYPWLFSRLSGRAGKLLDAGSVLNFEYLLQHPKLREKQLTITTLAPEAHCFWNKQVSYVFGDLRETCFRDEYFNEVACLSTLEHIGLDNTVFYTDDPAKRERAGESYLLAVRELRRILKSGGSCFVTVPFGAAKNKRWLQIFDKSMVESVLSTFAPSRHELTYFRYSPQRGWQLSSAELASDATYFDVHFDVRWQGCPAAAEAVVCMELIK